MTNTQTILDFFDEIGLNYRLESLSENTFLPGIHIHQGGLVIDVEKLKYPGDLLHEAGHIAVTAVTERAQLCGDMKFAGHNGAEETAAIAWSYAACKYINMAPDDLFHADGYKGGSQNLIDAFEQGRGFGFPLLAYWGMCDHVSSSTGYPTMQKWFRDQ